MAKLKREIVGRVGFTPKKGASYGFLVNGPLVVVENGRPRTTLQIEADPASQYKLEGKNIVRLFVPRARDARRRREQERAAAMEDTMFQAAMYHLETKTRSRGKKMTFETGAIDEDLVGFVFRDRNVDVAKDAATALKHGALLFRTRFRGETDDVIALVPGTDPIELCELLQNPANVDVEIDDVKRVLRSLRRAAPFVVHTAMPDRIEAKLKKTPVDVAKHARALASLGAESLTAAEAAKMLRSRAVMLWWD